MKPCPNCQQEMRDGTMFCPHCGFRLAAPLTDNKLLTGSPIGDVIVGIILHVLILTAFNALIRAISYELYNFSLFYSPGFSGFLYYIVAWRMKYKSLGAGIYWSYILGVLAIIGLVVLILGICMVGGGLRH